MPKAKDITNQRFGRLVAVERADSTAQGVRWACRCDCGNAAVVLAKKLNNGHTKSCGCLNVDQLKARSLDRAGVRYGRLVALERSGYLGNVIAWRCQCDCGNVVTVRGINLGVNTNSCGCSNREKLTKHGLSRHPAYHAWVSMRHRCLNPASKAYPSYGGRGITICNRWIDSAENFIEDMGAPPSSEHTLDRIDNAHGYSKENCRWATWKEQQQNRRTTRLVTHDGQTKCVAEWAREYGINKGALGSRLRNGWPVEKALKTPVKSMG